MNDILRDTIVFAIRGSRGTYALDVRRWENNVSLRCSCPAFVRGGAAHRLACKHVLAVLRGDRDGMVEPLAEDLTLLEEWFGGSGFAAMLEGFQASKGRDSEVAEQIREELRRTYNLIANAPSVRAGKAREDRPGGGPEDGGGRAPVVFIDVETTGLHSAFGDRIIEIAIVAEDGTVLLDELVDPEGKRSNAGALEKHGILDEELIGKPRLRDLASRINEAVRGNIVVGWNVKFECGFLGELLDKAADIVDGMARFGRGRNFVKLEEAIGEIGYRWEGSEHRALPDTLACRAVWRWLDEKGVPLRTEPAKGQTPSRIENAEQMIAALEGRLQLLEAALTEIPAMRRQIEDMERLLRERD